MAKEIENEKKFVTDERLDILFRLFDRGYSDADIARIMFNVNRSTITRIRQSSATEFKQWILANQSK